MLLPFTDYSQALNILFALCGITGALYGMGQRSIVLLGRGTMETAMFVCLRLAWFSEDEETIS